MDSTRFDALARTIATTTSRRRVLGGLAAGLIGILGASDATGAGATGCAGPGRVCRTGAGCCSGICGPKDGTGRRRCVCGEGTEPCAGDCVDLAIYQSDPLNCGGCGNRCPGAQCSVAVCNAGVCGLTPDAAQVGNTCNDGSLCVTGETCQADGTCGGGVEIAQFFPCANGGRCYQGVCLLAPPHCGGACGANAASPDGINMCWGISAFCGNPNCATSSDCGPGYFCGYTNTCGNGFEARCFEGCPVEGE